MFKNLEELITIIRKRKQKPIENSYTNKLLSNRKLNIEKIRRNGRTYQSCRKHKIKYTSPADIFTIYLYF